MEYVDGDELAALLRRNGRVPMDKGLEDHAHARCRSGRSRREGVLHRGFKPANIMSDVHGEVRIMDFGLAAVAEQIESTDVRSGYSLVHGAGAAGRPRSDGPQ